MPEQIPEQMARKFHEIYERLAPSLGYTTREDTRQFDSTSANGKLMTAVCAEMLHEYRMASADRFKPIMARRMTGKFHTPLRFCRLALDYMDRLIPGWRSKIMYDPCAGTGNLQFYIGCPANTWLSTLEAPDVEYLKSSAIAPSGQCFQVDYLADQALLDGIEMPDPEIILMNPPYGESGGGVSKGSNKAGIAQTAIKKQLAGVVSNDISSQFLFRVHRDHPSATVCVFEKAKFMCSPSYKAFRRDVWTYKLVGGFCFPGQAFDGVKGKFPVLFTIWEPAVKYEDNVALDVLNLDGEKIGTKVFLCPDKPLSKWPKRPKNDIPAVPLKSPLEVTTGKVYVDHKAVGSIAFIKYPGLDVQHNVGVFVLSSAVGSGNGFSITPANLFKACIMWAVRRLVVGNWINDGDRYSIPHTEPSPEWQNDCIAYCLIHGSNQTSSLRGIEYDGKKWDVRNEWVVPTLAELRGYPCTDPKMRGWLRGATQDGHIARTLPQASSMSAEGTACIGAVKAVWRVFFENAHVLDLEKFKIGDWDTGWWQIRNALKDRNLGKPELDAADKARRALAAKLLPGVYGYGFLPKESNSRIAKGAFRGYPERLEITREIICEQMELIESSQVALEERIAGGVK